METKKTPKANLELRKGLFLKIGLVFALLIVIAAFEWRSYDSSDDLKFERQAVSEVEEVVITIQEETPPPPPEEAPQLETTEYVVVDDDKKIEGPEVDPTIFSRTDNITINPSIKIEPEPETVQEEPKFFVVVEQDAEFPGGYGKALEYLKKTIKYPQQARETGTKGRVILQFIVELDGSLTDIKILRDIGGGCGAEAIRAVKLMPKWNPAKQRGKTVRQQFQLPVDFNLEG
ncbi:MAG: TonB family protein [Bacteroidales bacterium]|jgi:protein TonB|nr:TonB family protein [Bacteroidales bacterium]